MQEVRTTIYLAVTKYKAHACVSSKLRQMHEACVWRPKREAQKACVSEASPLKRDIQKHEVCTSSQRHKTRFFTTEHGNYKVRVS